MKLLVTGGAGFIGSNFVHHWVKNHPRDQVVILDKLTYAGHLSSIKNLPSSRCRFVRGDICNAGLVGSLMPGTDTVVHFAAESHVDRSITDPFTFVKTNVLGTQVLLNSARHHHIRRFHHISTDEVFGDLPLHSRDRFTETRVYAPHSPYSASKAAADHLVRAYFHTYGVNVTISNCSNNYGPCQDPEKFIPRMITNLLTGQKIQIYGNGKNIRDWLHVSDHCRAVESIILRGSPGETYCIGGQTRLFNNLQIARKIIRIMDAVDDVIVYVPDRTGHDLKYAVNWSKINHRLHWSPRYDLDQGLSETVDWYKQNSWWWKPLKKRAESIY